MEHALFREYPAAWLEGIGKSRTPLKAPLVELGNHGRFWWYRVQTGTVTCPKALQPGEGYCRGTTKSCYMYGRS